MGVGVHGGGQIKDSICGGKVILVKQVHGENALILYGQHIILNH